jgi:PAS domain S-box-containing protein
MNSVTIPENPLILVVEDDASHRDLVLRSFRDDHGQFRVTVAGTIREARSILASDSPDLIIADWLLPDGKGIEILPRSDGLVTVPLIIMTSHGDEHLAVEIMKSGAIDYVVKSATMFRELPHIALRALRDWENILERERAEKELQDKESQLSLIYRSMSEALFFLSAEQDNRYRFISVNQAFLDITGLTSEQIIGRYVHEVIPEPSLTLVLEKYNQAILENTTVTWEEITVYPSGKKYGEVSVTPLTDAAGRCTNLVGIVHDITERKGAEDKLRESEARYRLLADNLSDVLWVLDPETMKWEYMSPSVKRLLGYTLEEVLVKSIGELMTPASYVHVQSVLPGRIEQFRNNESGPNTYLDEMEQTRSDGSAVWVEMATRFTRNEQGGIILQGVSRNISDRKRAEQALAGSEERLRQALEGADAASWDWNLATGITVFSDRYYTMLDYAPGEFPATYDAWAAMMHPDDRNHVIPDLWQQIREKRPLCEIEYRLLSKDRDWIWILGRGKITAFDEQGNPLRLTGVNIDITSRKLMESEIRSLNTVLEQRVKDRTEALTQANVALEEENSQRVVAESRLQASLDEKVTLIREVHHRVKNNLQIIISLLNLQSRYITDEKTLAAIRESQNRVRAMALVHEKLYQADNVSKIQIQEYIRFLGNGLIQFYGAKSRGVHLTLDIGDIDAPINTAIPLGLIINELISNSLKYAFPEGKTGEITITVRKEGCVLRVQYRDNGIGIPESLDWKNTRSLGLRLVNTLVDQLSGTVELDRHDGTYFSLVLNEKE